MHAISTCCIYNISHAIILYPLYSQSNPWRCMKPLRTRWQKNDTPSPSLRLQKAQAINKSLLALGDVLSAPFHYGSIEWKSGCPLHSGPARRGTPALGVLCTTFSSGGIQRKSIPPLQACSLWGLEGPLRLAEKRHPVSLSPTPEGTSN